MNDQLHSILKLSEGLPYFKDNFFERRARKFALRGGLILVILLAAYSPSLFGNVMWIDEVEKTHADLLHGLNGLGQLWIWRHPTLQPVYQPMAETVLWLQYHLWGDAPLGYHLVSLLLHMTNCMLVWAILRRLDFPGAWLAAAVFALHPMQIQAVAWVGGQPMLVGTLFYASSLLLFLRYATIEPPQDLDPTIKLSEEWYESHPDAPEVQIAAGVLPKTSYVFSLALFVCAVLSDRAAWTIPLVVLMILWWRGGGITRKDVKSLVPYFVIGGIMFLFGAFQMEWYASRQGIGTDLPIMGRLLLPGRVVAYYFVKLLVPYPLSFSGPQWTVNAGVWWQYLFLIALVGALAFIWQRREWLGRGPVTGIVFFLLNLIPAMGFVRFGWMRYSFVGDYLQYRASIGLISIGIGVLMVWISRAKSEEAEQMLRIAGAFILVALLSGLALARCFDYLSPVDLWKADVTLDPDSDIANIRLARAVVDDETDRPYNKYDTAIHGLKKILEKKPDDIAIMSTIAAMSAEKDHPWTAEDEYTKILKLHPNDPEALMHAAGAKARAGKIDEAIGLYLKVISLTHNDPKPHEAVAELYASQGKLDDAITHIQKAVDIAPNSVSLRLTFARYLFKAAQMSQDAGQKSKNAGQIELAKDQFKRSAEQLQIAAKLDPKNFEVYMTSGEMLSILGDFQGAERMYTIACIIRPNSCEAWNNKGVALAAQKRFSEAVFAFNQALKIKPEFTAAQKNLESAENALKHPQEPVVALPEPHAPATSPAADVTRPTTSPRTAPKAMPATEPTR